MCVCVCVCVCVHAHVHTYRYARPINGAFCVCVHECALGAFQNTMHFDFAFLRNIFKPVTGISFRKLRLSETPENIF